MTDREALAAALELTGGISQGQERFLNPIIQAARERLAQLPERCHDHWHLVATPRPESCPSCDDTGRVYPPALLERIAQVICRHQHLSPEVPCQAHRTTAIAVLEALLETL